METLRIACLKMNASANLETNLQQISAGIHAAAHAGAHILLTPECALSGYPGACRENFEDINWCAYDGHEDLVHTRAQAAGIAVVLGSISKQDSQIYNDALFCGHDVRVSRYHKRCLTPFDKKHFSSGSAPCLIDYKDWKIGITVCYDVRFPHSWGDLVANGAELILSIAHMAGPDPDLGVKNTVVPNHYSSRAAEWATPLVLCNTTHEKRWLENNAWDARGMRCEKVSNHASELIDIFDAQKRSAFDAWYSEIHADAVRYHQQR